MLTHLINRHLTRSITITEVDFILYGGDTFIAIEVKLTDKIRKADLKGPKSFQTDYPEARSLFLYMEEETLIVDEILFRPVSEFFADLIPNQILLDNQYPS